MDNGFRLLILLGTLNGEARIMSNFLDDSGIGIPCESCGNETEKTIGWVKRNKQLTCRCGAVVSIDASQFKTEIAKIEREFAKLDKMFK